jgi:hypothetical protein
MFIPDKRIFSFSAFFANNNGYLIETVLPLSGDWKKLQDNKTLLTDRNCEENESIGSTKSSFVNQFLPGQSVVTKSSAQLKAYIINCTCFRTVLKK